MPRCTLLTITLPLPPPDMRPPPPPAGGGKGGEEAPVIPSYKIMISTRLDYLDQAMGYANVGATLRVLTTSTGNLNTARVFVLLRGPPATRAGGRTALRIGPGPPSFSFLRLQCGILPLRGRGTWWCTPGPSPKLPLL